MITLNFAAQEFVVKETMQIIRVPEQTLTLEHSLLSVSKWEEIFKRPFLSRNDITREETLEYVKCMVLNETYDPRHIEYISSENLQKLTAYIEESHTATIVSKHSRSTSSEQITSELMYYWLVSAQIPFEVQHWNLSRLLALLQIFEVKNSKQKKMPANEIAARNRALNEQRKAQLNTQG